MVKLLSDIQYSIDLTKKALKCQFFVFSHVITARASVRAHYFFILMYSAHQEYDSNILNEWKITKIDNYNWLWKSSFLKTAKKTWKISNVWNSKLFICFFWTLIGLIKASFCFKYFIYGAKHICISWRAQWCRYVLHCKWNV